MFLIPFIYKQSESIYPIHIFHIFLKKGISFLQIEEFEIDSFLEENEIFFTKKNIINNFCFVEINPLKTHIQNFYSYLENSDAECWRRFIMIGNETEDFLHINSTNPDFIRPVLKNILQLL